MPVAADGDEMMLVVVIMMVKDEKREWVELALVIKWGWLDQFLMFYRMVNSATGWLRYIALLSNIESFRYFRGLIRHLHVVKRTRSFLLLVEN